MLTNSKPLPLYPPRMRAHCPVCGQTSYSAAGIHPQCAMQRADAARIVVVKQQAAKAAKVVLRDKDVKPWQRDCPKCHVLVHVRKKVCDCGHVLISAKAR